MTKFQPAAIVALVNNNRSRAHQGGFRGRAFVEPVFFPFHKRKWKRPTLLTNEDRFQKTMCCQRSVLITWKASQLMKKLGVTSRYLFFGVLLRVVHVRPPKSTTLPTCQ